MRTVQSSSWGYSTRETTDHAKLKELMGPGGKPESLSWGGDLKWTPFYTGSCCFMTFHSMLSLASVLCLKERGHLIHAQGASRQRY